MGAASSAGAAVVLVPPPQPQAGSALQQLLQLEQHDLLQHLWQAKMSSRPRWQCLWQQRDLRQQPPPQLLAQPQPASAAQPQLGAAAAQPQLGASAAQLG